MFRPALNSARLKGQLPRIHLLVSEASPPFDYMNDNANDTSLAFLLYYSGTHVILCIASVLHLQVKEVMLQVQPCKANEDLKTTKEPRASESCASGSGGSCLAA